MFVFFVRDIQFDQMPGMPFTPFVSEWSARVPYMLNARSTGGIFIGLNFGLAERCRLDTEAASRASPTYRSLPSPVRETGGWHSNGLNVTGRGF